MFLPDGNRGFLKTAVFRIPFFLEKSNSNPCADACRHLLSLATTFRDKVWSIGETHPSSQGEEKEEPGNVPGPFGGVVGQHH